MPPSLASTSLLIRTLAPTTHKPNSRPSIRTPCKGTRTCALYVVMFTGLAVPSGTLTCGCHTLMLTVHRLCQTRRDSVCWPIRPSPTSSACHFLAVHSFVHLFFEWSGLSVVQIPRVCDGIANRPSGAVVPRLGAQSVHHGGARDGLRHRVA